MGSLTNPDIQCVGLAINTAALGDAEAERCLAEVAEQHGLPAADPMRGGVGPVVDELIRRFP